MVGPCEMVRGRFRGGVRRIGCIGGLLVEEAGWPETAKDLIRRYVNEAKVGTAELRYISARAFEQVKRPDDVGLDERSRPVYRPIDMRLCREIYNGDGPKLGQKLRDERSITDVAVGKRIVWMLARVVQVGRVAGIR